MWRIFYRPVIREGDRKEHTDRDGETIVEGSDDGTDLGIIYVWLALSGMVSCSGELLIDLLAKKYVGGCRRTEMVRQRRRRRRWIRPWNHLRLVNHLSVFSLALFHSALSSPFP